jgi:hypothetical protein
MLDLERQLHGYGQQLETYMTPFTADELIGEAPRPARPPSAPRRRGWLVAVGAAVVVLLAIGLVRWLIPILVEAPVVSEKDETTGTTSPASSLEPDRWARVPHDEAVFGGAEPPEAEIVITHVVAGGPGLVAIGSWDRGENGGSFAAVWTSADGITWDRLPLEAEVFGDGWIYGLTSHGSELVATGAYRAEDDIETGTSYVGTAAVWTSPDGLTWSRILLDKATFGVAILEDVVSLGGVLVVGGQVCSGEPFIDENPDCRAAMWTSPDGVEWTNAYTDADTGGDVEGLATVPGGVVAVGSCCGDQPLSSAVWFSPDGRSWTRIEDAAVFGDSKMTHVAAGGSAVVALGRTASSFEPVVWTSSDGSSWKRVDGVDIPTDVGQLIAVEGTFLLVSRGPEGLSVWVSPDGVSWEQHLVEEGAAEAQIEDLAVGGPGLVAVGHEDGFRGVIWVSPPDGVPVEETTTTTTTEPTGPSAAEYGWTRIELDPAEAGEGWMADVIAGGPGFVSVGYDKVQKQGVVWTSSDGSSWTRTADVTSATAPETWLDAVASDGSQLLAVGRLQDKGDIGVGIWRSDDGQTWTEVSLDGSFSGVYVFLDIASTPFGWVVTGTGFDESGQKGTVWRSVDGVTWEVVLEVRPGLMTAATSAGSGAAVLGGAVDETGEVVTGIWLSEEGVVWTLTFTDAGHGAAITGDITEWAGGLAATGSGEPSAAWISVSGLEWALASEFESFEVRSIAPRGEGLVVAGRGEGGRVDVWVTDGGAPPWGNVPDNGDVFGPLGSPGIIGMVQGGPGLVAVGSIFLDREIPTVWLWSPEG